MEAYINNNFGQIRVDFHEFCNFIPIVSTITNTIAVVEKYLYVPDLDSDHSLDNDFYYSYLKAKDFGKEWQLFIPGVNFIFCVLRCCCSSPDTDTTVDENLPVDDPAGNVDNAISFAEEIDTLKNETSQNLSEILNQITDETSQEEKSVAVKEISSSLTKFFNIFCPIKDGQVIDRHNRQEWFELVDKIKYCLSKDHEIKQTFILDIIRSCKTLTADQRAVLIQGFKGCEDIPFLSVYYGCGHTGHPYDAEVKFQCPEMIWFPEIIKLYETEPDVAKFLLQETVRTYSIGKTRHNKALNYLVDCMTTKEQVIDYLEACKNLSTSIREDNYLKLAAFIADDPWHPAIFPYKRMNFSDFKKHRIEVGKDFRSDKKDAIIEAFKEMEIDYVPLLPKNNWVMKDMNQDIANSIYSHLPIDTLAKMTMTCQIKSEEHSVPGYVHKHLIGDMSIRLHRLFELYNRLTKSKENSGQKAHFLKELNGLIKSLKENPAVLLDDEALLQVTKLELERDYAFFNVSTLSTTHFKETLENDTFNNHLSKFIKNELFSKFTFSSESDGILLSNCLDLLFKVGTDELLEDFITALLLPSDIMQLDLIEKSFYSQLTDKRIERLASIVKTKDAKLGCIILQNIFKCAFDVYPDKQENKAWTSEEIQILELAEKLTIAFYNEMPDLTKWEELIKSLKSDDKIKRKECIFDFFLIGKSFVQFFALAETLDFLSKSLELEEQIWIEKNTIRHKFLARLYATTGNFWNNFLPKRYIERTLLHICEAQEDFTIKEKKLVNFVQSIIIKSLIIDPHRWCDLLFNVCSKINLEDQELTVEIQTIIYSTMVDIFYAYDHVEKLTACISTEQQFHIFYKIFLELPEPSRTIQLTILRDHISKKIVGLDEVFKDALLISNLNVEELGMVDTLNEVQIFVDKIRSLENLDQLTAWLKENRMDHFKLQALAQGVKMPDGSLLKCPLEPGMIKQAFSNEKLSYKGYKEPIDLKTFIEEYN